MPPISNVANSIIRNHLYICHKNPNGVLRNKYKTNVIANTTIVLVISALEYVSSRYNNVITYLFSVNLRIKFCQKKRQVVYTFCDKKVGG